MLGLETCRAPPGGLDDGRGQRRVVTADPFGLLGHVSPTSASRSGYVNAPGGRGDSAHRRAWPRSP
jgi:hypothetical protein